MKRGNAGDKKMSGHGITIFVVLVMMTSMLSAFNFLENAEAHIDEGVGDPLQLYSYFDPDASSKINFNQFTDDGIGRNPGEYDEWEGAYVRNITISNFNGDDRFCYLFLANDDNYLYIGIVYQADNTGTNNYVRIYFDEGDGVGSYDGTHDDSLTANNENYIISDRNENLDDGFYDGTGWQSDASIDITDVKVAWGVSYMNYEFKIPLDNGVDGATGSDLNVVSTDELGIFLEIRVLGVLSGEIHYWDLTGNDPTNVTAYADLQLGVQKKTATTYSTYANTGNPVIDGDISNDFAYANAYRRELTLTNFRGMIISATLYMCEDPPTTGNGYIYIGLVVYADDTDIGDYLRVYFEQDHSVGPPWGDKDGVLSDGGAQKTEHYQQLNGDNTYIEGYWDSSAEIWQDDASDGDEVDGLGAETYINAPGIAYDRYEFEFLVPYEPLLVSPYIDPDHDLYVTSPSLIGFLMRFHDESAPLGEQEFYWDLTTNLDAIKTRATAGGIFLATGWAYLQMGGPALKPITPIDGGTVFGTNYIFRVEAQDEDGFDGVDFVGFQVEGETSWISLVRESTTNGIWYTYWDTTAHPDGKYNITIVAQDNESIVVKRIISVTIANGGAVTTPPTITLTMPTKDGTINGTVEFQAVTIGIVSAVEFYIDDQLIATMTSISTDTWRYYLDTTFWNDGGHVISVIAKNAAGEGADAGTYIFDNWDLNLLDITQPVSGSPVTGPISVIGDFEVDNSGDYAELFVDDEFIASSNTPSDLGGGNMGFIFNLDTSMLSEGSHQVKMLAYDPDGNKAMDMILMIVDNLFPDAPTIVSMFEGQYVEGIFTFQVQCDSTDLAGVDLTVRNASTEVISNTTIGYNSASGYYEFSLNTNALEDGNYTAITYARDSVGKTASSSPVNFKIDNNAPILEVSYPLDNSIVNGDMNFVYSAIDPFLRDVMFKIDGNSWVDISTTWDTTSFNDGTHTVKIRARDHSGHETTVTLILVVDNNDPTVSIINPISDQFIEDFFIFKIMARDAVGVDEVRITITNTDTASTIVNDIPIGYNSASGYHEFTLGTSSLEDGNYTLSCISYDLSGQDSGDKMMSFHIDNNAPLLRIISPLSGELLTGTVTINAQAEDMFMSSLTYSIDGSGWSDISTSWDTAELEDGTHTLEIRAMDRAGHSVTQAIEVRTDNNGPTIDVVSLPNNNTHVDGSFFIQVYIEDVIGLDKVSYKFDDSESVRMFVNRATGFYEAKVVTDSTGLGLSDGTHDFTITAVDTAGLKTEIKRSIIVDNTGPNVLIVSPTPSDIVSGDVEFFVTVTDISDVERVYIRIDKGQWKEMKKRGDDSYIYNWNSRKVYNGKYDVDVKAVDTLGNEIKESTVVKVDNFPWLGFIVFIIGLAVLLILMMASWPKKEKPGYPAEEEEAPSEPEKEEEEEVPPPPEKATIAELLGEEEEEIDEIVEGIEESEVPPAPPQKSEPSEELYEDETDKLAPPEPEDEY